MQHLRGAPMSDWECELPEVKGYDYTEWDCPKCGDANRAEGDIKSEEAQCENCGLKVWVT